MNTMDVVFDIDGTLLNIEHRVHLIRPPEGVKKDWQAFRRAAEQDTANVEIAWLANIIFNRHEARVVISSGRMEKERQVTLRSLGLAGVSGFHALYMRKNEDVRPDHVVKLEMLAQMRLDGYDPRLVFDDRQQVVDMWRAQGLRVCQVAPGQF
jgi:phosphoglycolate phosphatase-like HAD superfamily hydrolase